ncbi:MAG: UDP-N-acetylmuramoyl-tripeptide--D-alanyl-D-alanine ligase [Hyphomicrobiaceae bacterium]|nr:UDP-N-acetylmuramoyl-tripeptide--D-alanyl-D-alanine ligase [Hyphomicrobiaceae bacterium]
MTGAANEPLWTISDAAMATAAVTDGVPISTITGISIDTRTLNPGDLFVALSDARDGHEFVTAAFGRGATAALVRSTYARRPGDGLLLRVGDPLDALVALGRAARARLSHEARVIAVTGSAGKTTTKEMLRAVLSAIGQTHASEKSYNNHWGVPLTLARMPARSQFGVFEIGMNHAGEITPLTKMVRPHVAIITTVGRAHLENFADGEAGIARAKAEIFAGLPLPPQIGTAIIPADNAHVELLKREASKTSNVVTFGFERGLVRGTDIVETALGTSVRVERPRGAFRFRIGTTGRHNVSNALAVAAALDAIGLDAADAIGPLSGFGAPAGRGSRHLIGEHGTILLIDESYNANPDSMQAALVTLGEIPRERFDRRLVVLGDMLELGEHAPAMHADLAEPIAAAGIDLVFACGPNMAHLYAQLPEQVRGGWAATSGGLEADLVAAVRPGDAVMVKGSNGSRMAPLVEALRSRHSPGTAKT